MLQAADTVGVFQVESRAQMATLPRLKPACFYDLVVQVAIIRPGPIVGQMVHPYLNRRAGREPVVYDHPLLEPMLKRTLGVPLFQEQLLRMAMVVAGFTGGQAEDLRRAMGFKRSEKRMQQIEGQLREGMAKRGITGEAADRIVRSITSFALYGFPESHAASFALHRLCQRVSQGALPGGVLHGAAQQPADGVLSSGHAGEGRAAARRALRADRRAGVGLGLHGGAKTARFAWACATWPACARRWARRLRPGGTGTGTRGPGTQGQAA